MAMKPKTTRESIAKSIGDFFRSEPDKGAQQHRTARKETFTQKTERLKREDNRTGKSRGARLDD